MSFLQIFAIFLIGYARSLIIKKYFLYKNLNFFLTIKILVKDLKSGNEFDDNYDKLILAIGSWPIIPPIEGIKWECAHIVKWFQHGELVKKANDDKNIQNVVVCMSGYIGVELFYFFHQKGKNVTPVEISDRIMSHYYDNHFTDKVEASMRKAGVNLHGGEKVIKFEGNNNKVTKVVTDKCSYDADLLICLVRFKPATEILNSVIDLDKNVAIKVDQYIQTSYPNIFATGNCVEVYDNANK